MATLAEFQAAMDQVETLANDLSKWFLGVGFDLKQLSDGRAQRTAALTVGGAKAAARLGSGIASLSSIFSSYIQTSPPGGTIKFGLTSGFTLTGSPPEFDAITETGKTWVTADTVVIAFPPGPRTSAEEAYNVAVSDYTVGVGFKVTLYAGAGSAAASDYDVYWVGFPDGINA